MKGNGELTDRRWGVCSTGPSFASRLQSSHLISTARPGINLRIAVPLTAQGPDAAGGGGQRGARGKVQTGLQQEPTHGQKAVRGDPNQVRDVTEQENREEQRQQTRAGVIPTARRMPCSRCR